MPGEKAQQLRAMVLSGAKLGLSIDFLAAMSHSGVDGTRYLDEVTVLGAAIVTHPANSLAMITSGKTSALVPMSTVEQEIERGAALRNPAAAELRRKATILAASSWPGPELVASLGVEKAFALADSAAKAQASRARDGDPERAAAQRRRDQANSYSNALSRWMREHRPTAAK